MSAIRLASAAREPFRRDGRLRAAGSGAGMGCAEGRALLFPPEGVRVSVSAKPLPALRIHRQEWGLTPKDPLKKVPGTPFCCTGTAFPQDPINLLARGGGGHPILLHRHRISPLPST